MDNTKNVVLLVLSYLYIFMNIFFLIRPLVVTFTLFPSWRHYNCIINVYCYNLTFQVKKGLHTKKLGRTQLQRTCTVVTYYQRPLTQINKHIYTANVRSICPQNGIQILTSRLSCQCDGRLLRTQTVFI